MEISRLKLTVSSDIRKTLENHFQNPVHVDKIMNGLCGFSNMFFQNAEYHSAWSAFTDRILSSIESPNRLAYSVCEAEFEGETSVLFVMDESLMAGNRIQATSPNGMFDGEVSLLTASLIITQMVYGNIAFDIMPEGEIVAQQMEKVEKIIDNSPEVDSITLALD